MTPPPRRPAGKSDVPPSSAPRPSPFTTRAQAEFRNAGRKRLAGAVVVALLGLLAIVVFGPDEQEIKERFEYYGAPGELKIMDEISVVEGQDRAEQLPRSLQVPPPPAELEIEEEPLPEDGFEPVPEPREADPVENETVTNSPLPDAETADDYQVEMALPMQTSPYYRLLHAPRPDYPLGARETERRTPVITVVVNIWLAVDGTVSDAIVQRSSGSPAFEEAALAAVRTWRFGWVDEPRPGLNLVIPFNFKSPYFTPDR